MELRKIEEAKKENVTAVLCFIDFKKTFDLIHRSMMVKIREEYNISPSLCQATETLYAGTRAKIVTPDGNSEEFHMMTGAMQGDTLAPRHPAVVLTDLDYADDICLLSDNVEQAQELLNREELECAKVDLSQEN